MFKSVHRNVWVFDIEWVPDANAGRCLYDLPDSMPEAEVWNFMWQQGGADDNNPRPYLKTALCRIASIAAIVRQESKEGKATLWLMSLPRDPTDETQR